MKQLILTVTFGLLGGSVCLAEGLEEACKELITSGLREFSIETESSSYLSSVYSRYCETSGSVKSSSMGVGIDLVVKAIPLGLTGSYSSNEEGMRNFCKNYAGQAQANSAKLQYESKIVQRAYDSFDQCVQIARSGVVVRHKIRDLNHFDFFVAPGFSRPVTLRGAQVAPNVVCEAQDPTAADHRVKKLGLNTHMVLTGDSTLNVACTRSGTATANGATRFDEATVTLLTNITPLGNYSAYLPEDTLLSQDQASVLAQQMAGLLAANAALQTQLDAHRKSMLSGRSSVGGLNGHHGVRVDRTITFVDEANKPVRFEKPPRVVATFDEQGVGHPGLNWVVNVLSVSETGFKVRIRATVGNSDGNYGWSGDAHLHWIAYADY